MHPDIVILVVRDVCVILVWYVWFSKCFISLDWSNVRLWSEYVLFCSLPHTTWLTQVVLLFFVIRYQFLCFVLLSFLWFGLFCCFFNDVGLTSVIWAIVSVWCNCISACSVYLTPVEYFGVLDEVGRIIIRAPTDLVHHICVWCDWCGFCICIAPTNLSSSFFFWFESRLSVPRGRLVTWVNTFVVRLEHQGSSTSSYLVCRAHTNGWEHNCLQLACLP